MQIAPAWWHADELGADDSGLRLDGHGIAKLAAPHGTPLYVYSANTIRRRFPLQSRVYSTTRNERAASETEAGKSRARNFL